MTGDYSGVSKRAILSRVGPLNYRLGRVLADDDAMWFGGRDADVIEATWLAFAPPPQKVRVVFGDGEIESASCTCATGDAGLCPHIAATLIAYSVDPGRFGTKIGPDAALERRSKSELIELIDRLMKLRPVLDENPDSLSGSDSPAPGLDEFESTRRSAAFAFTVRDFDYAVAVQAASDLESSLEAGDDYLVQNDFGNAIIVFAAVAEAILDFAEIATVLVDYDLGEFESALEHCIGGLAAGLTATNAELATRNTALRALLEAHLQDSSYLGTLFADQAGALIAANATSTEKSLLVCWLRAGLPRGQTFIDHVGRQIRGEFMLELVQADWGEEACIQICRECDLAVELADLLLSKGRIDDALEGMAVWDNDLPQLAKVFDLHGFASQIEPFIGERFESNHDPELAEWLKRRHLERGEWREALPFAELLFELEPQIPAFRELRELAIRAGQWENVEGRALRAMMISGDTYALAADYIDEGAIEPALELAAKTYIGAYNMNRLILAAEAAAERHPRIAVARFRRLAEIYFGLQGRKNYEQACRQLLRLRDLHRRSGLDFDWRGFIAEIRHRYRNRPALQEELLRFGL